MSIASSDQSPSFDDGKAPGALRTIGEVARALSIRQHVLRYWEEQFQALQPIKRSGGRRYYRPEDVALIMEIDRLVHREGYTLRGAAKALVGRSGAGKSGADKSGDPAAERQPDRESGAGDDGILRGLMEVRHILAEALAAA